MTLEEEKQLILDRADIVDVISSYLDLHRKGENYVCNCPFHDEKTGSFTVSSKRKMYSCFGCGKSGNVFDFLIDYLHIGFAEAKNILANKVGIVFDEKLGFKTPEVVMSKAEPQDEYSYEKKDFTKYELSLLGPKITPEVCAKFNFISLKSFTRAKNKDGVSWRYESTPDFPIFMYEFDGWGKIYQPLSKDFRFSFLGSKPDNFIYGNDKVMRLIDKVNRGEEVQRKPSKEDDLNSSVDYKVPNLVLCSGGTDAMNLYAETKYNVCFLNSETEVLSDYQYKQILKKIVEFGTLHVLYDLDPTGIRQSSNLGLRFIDLKLVYLPADLRKFRDSKGRPCKDVKDFFIHYKHHRYTDKKYLMESIIKNSSPLCFWDAKTDKEGNFTGYDINNQQLYGFLAALGIYRLPNEQAKKGFVYIHEQNKVVKIIPDEGLQSYVNDLLINYLRENLDLWNVSLVNAIHRSNQVKIGSLEKMNSIELDFKSFDKKLDFLFFRNTAVKVTDKEIEMIRFENIEQSVFEDKILDFDYRKLEAPFQIEYTKEYRDAKSSFEAASTTDPNYTAIKREFEKFDPLKRFSLSIEDKTFSTIQYIYNTGRVHWRKEENKIPLSEEELAEHNLHFINKIMALGYLMFRHKDDSRPYMVYAMETDLNEVGDHMGGTGKSMYLKLVEFVRKVFPVDGQNVKKEVDDTMFAGVNKGITDCIIFDDLRKDVDLHRFMPMATGNMEVRNLYENKVNLTYEESPKVAFSSNHGIGRFSASLRRRTWFTGFSSYYHPEDQNLGLPERSPRTEFGHNIPKDYSVQDMNRFYNFMIYCLHTYIKFGTRINPPMDNIEKRMLQRSLTDEFIWWADEFFGDKLNTDIDKNVSFEHWKANCLSEVVAKNVRTNTLKKKLQEYCQYHKHIFNPSDLLTTESEQKRGEKRGHEDGKDVYYWHIRTADKQDEINNEDKVEF